MTPRPDRIDPAVADALDRLAATAAMQSNCVFQLALMLARIAAEPCTGTCEAETYRAEAAQALMDLIRAKPKDGVVRPFGASGPAQGAWKAPPAPATGKGETLAAPATVLPFAARGRVRGKP